MPTSRILIDEKVGLRLKALFIYCCSPHPQKVPGTLVGLELLIGLARLMLVSGRGRLYYSGLVLIPLWGKTDKRRQKTDTRYRNCWNMQRVLFITNVNASIYLKSRAREREGISRVQGSSTSIHSRLFGKDLSSLRNQLLVQQMLNGSFLYRCLLSIVILEFCQSKMSLHLLRLGDWWGPIPPPPRNRIVFLLEVPKSGRFQHANS